MTSVAEMISVVCDVCGDCIIDSAASMSFCK